MFKKIVDYVMEKGFLLSQAKTYFKRLDFASLKRMFEGCVNINPESPAKELLAAVDQILANPGLINSYKGPKYLELFLNYVAAEVKSGDIEAQSSFEALEKITNFFGFTAGAFYKGRELL
jgi:hypothetical protein